MERPKLPSRLLLSCRKTKVATAPKVNVRDSSGAQWIVKFGEEVKAENFASRIVWAAGYFADANYFVPSGKIEGVGELGRAKAFHS